MLVKTFQTLRNIWAVFRLGGILLRRKKMKRGILVNYLSLIKSAVILHKTPTLELKLNKEAILLAAVLGLGRKHLKIVITLMKMSIAQKSRRPQGFKYHLLDANQTASKLWNPPASSTKPVKWESIHQIKCNHSSKRSCNSTNNTCHHLLSRSYNNLPNMIAQLNHSKMNQLLMMITQTSRKTIFQPQRRTSRSW